MATQSVLEIVRCPKCNNIVPKQVYCRKCGQVLLNATPVTLSETGNKDENQIISPVPEPRRSAARASTSSSRSKSSTEEQIQQFRREYKSMEDARQNAQEGEESQLNGLESGVPEVDKMMSQKVEAEVSPADSDEVMVEERKPLRDGVDLRSYTPDPYTKEIVEKMAKQVKYEVNIVQLFKDGQVPEEIFMRLFHNMADIIGGLIARREEVVKELNGLMKGYKSTVLSAQQGMKLLDLRKSLDDVTEEEYVVKAAALNWDINHYGQRISEGRQKAEYLRSLGNLVPVEEVNDLKNISASCMEASSMKHISEGTREKIKKAMQDASSILDEVYRS